MVRSFLLPSILGVGFSACFTEPFPLSDSDSSESSASSTGSSGTTAVVGSTSDSSTETTSGASSETTSEESGGDPGVVPGNKYVPQILRPPRHEILPATRAFVSWEDGAIPEGRTLVGYDVCWTAGEASDLGTDSECPNPMNAENVFTVVDPLEANADYFTKVRARYDDGRSSQYSAAHPFSTDDTLLAWWRLNEGQGSVAADSGPEANDGILNGSAAWVTGRSGQALSFDGSSFVLIGDQASLEGMARLSVEAWFKTSAAGATRHIVSKWSAVDRSFALRTASEGDGRLVFQTFASEAVVLTSIDAFNDGAWHYAVGTYDGVIQQLYVDLSMQAAGLQTGPIADSASEFCLAESCSGGAGTGFGFDGAVDEIAVYGRELSEDERINGYCATLASAGVDPLPASCHP